MGIMSFFKPAARYPADPRAVFILALSVFSGITALALSAAPDSLAALVPKWGLVTWGIILSAGSAVSLLGMWRQTVGGVIIEQVGSIMVAAATLFYSILAFYVIGIDALQNVGIILAWGLACVVRWGQLQSLINDSLRRAEKLAFLQRLDEEIRARQARERAAHRRHGRSAL